MFLTTGPSAKARIQTHLEAINSAGEPTTLEALNESYPAVRGQNAATTYLKAFPMIKLDQMASGQLPEQLPMTGSEAASVQQIIRKHDSALQLLHKAADLPEARYPIDFTDGIATKIPHLSGVKDAIELLQLAALHRATSNEPDEAVAAVIGQLALVRSLKHEPLLLSQLVRMAGWNMATDTTESLLRTGAVSSDSLTRLATAFEETEDTNGLHRAFVGEKVMVIDLFKHPDQYQQASELLGASIPTGSSRNENFLFYLEKMKALEQAVQTGFTDRGTVTGELERQIKGDNGKLEKGDPLYLAKRLLNSMVKAPAREAKAVAMVRTTQAAIAIERYRLSESQLPNSLEELTPKYLTEVTSDPFSRGQPLRYRKLDEGYTVYSIGPDQADQQGDLYTPDDPADIAFVVD